MSRNLAPKNNSTKTKTTGNKKIRDVTPELFTKNFFTQGQNAEFKTAQTQKAAATFAFMQGRKTGGPKIEITTGKNNEQKPRTILKILNDDKTFLVDSVLAEVSRLGYKVYEIYHPVLKLTRDKAGRFQAFDNKEGKPESVIYLEISHIDSQAALTSLNNNLDSVLRALYLVVDDWRNMLVKVDETVKSLHPARAHLADEEADETMDFLKWLADDHFTFLGYSEYDLAGKKLKLTPKSALGVSRPEAAQDSNKDQKEVFNFSQSDDLLQITKSDYKAIVHRSVYMDHIGVKKFDSSGKVIGERRFLGLFASSAYYQSTSTIPIIRQKVKYVREKSGFTRGGHSAKIVQFILDSYPRDEIFQSSAEELLKNTLSILELTERPNVGLYIRRDAADRFLSCLVYVPREKFDTALRFRIQAILEKTLDAKVTEYYTQITDSPLSRLHLIIKPNNEIGNYEVQDLRSKIAEVSNLWGDELLSALTITTEDSAEALFSRYEKAFPKDYTAIYNSRHAAHDVSKIEETLNSNQLQVEFYDHTEPDNTISYHLKTYTPGESIALSDVLPILENFGLRVISEKPFFIEPQNATGVGISDFEVEPMNKQPIELAAIKVLLEEAFKKAALGEIENDPLNKLVLYANLPWRDVVLLRGYCRYLRQAGLMLGLDFFIEALTAQAGLTAQLVRLFYSYFDPKSKKKPEPIIEEIEQTLATVSNLNEDRAIRRLSETIQATLRTNFFQIGNRQSAIGNKEYISFKFDSRKVPDLPLPRPLYEVFVYSPAVEGIHLRGGMVARGGLRWSDRFEDFRTEVLGLMKAQMVKNSVIVPVGSKGGFIVKGTVPEDRDAKLKQGIECYKTFLRGVLDLTDNIIKGKIVPPQNVIRRDGDDPYLVVAADKGTATFSDIANSISEEYNFWLGDAFASGGSAGYDHKKMGITAKGGWISVQRHFREIGIDVQTQDHTCVGIGDMSGDVFGNGLLLSEHTNLVAAFNHMHIFLDPNPPTAAAFKERNRLFALPRSGWDDYDKKLISTGGGIFKRSEKSIKLTPEVKKLLDITDNALSPDELIRAIMKAPVDLIWNGGIGTYVKAELETARDVGDKNNDNLRINGKELRSKVIGEGGNLGFTQLGRIEYAMTGGRINTDAIDNSAGVDTSDHEVNIKIPLQAAIEKKKLTLANRNKLLVKMTDEVAELVLRDNYLQTQAISIAETRGAGGNESRAALMRKLEEDGLLKRKIEFLPSDEEISRRTSLKQSFTRPEISVLLAYSKIWLYNQLVDSNLPNEEYFKADLLRYFPLEMQKKYASELESHKLRREIIATFVTNSIVNRAGSTFFSTIIKDSGMKTSDVASAYTATRDAFSLRDLWKQIENLDGQVDAKIQYEMFLDIGKFIERQTMWFLRNVPLPLNVEKTINRFKPYIEKFAAQLDGMKNDFIETQIENHQNSLIEHKVPTTLAKQIASLRAMISACDTALITETGKLPLNIIGKVYFASGQRLGLNWLRASAAEIPTDTYWQRLASKNLIDSLYEQQRRITRDIVSSACKTDKCDTALDSWVTNNTSNLERHDNMITELQKAPEKFDLAMLIAAVRRIETLGSI